MNIVLPNITPGDDYPLMFRFIREGAAVPQTGASIRVIIKNVLTQADVDAVYDEVFDAASPDMEQGIIRTPILKAFTRTLAQKTTVYLQARWTFSGQTRSTAISAVKVNETVIDND